MHTNSTCSKDAGSSGAHRWQPGGLCCSDGNVPRMKHVQESTIISMMETETNCPATQEAGSSIDMNARSANESLTEIFDFRHTATNSAHPTAPF
mmetsp:Transcript_68282/g.138842  ORF Transcript_68282/g.138842 Transcript_68282/m.138842 type:complete len:94 (+) Transcript_68282:78-359(+)